MKFYNFFVSLIAIEAMCFISSCSSDTSQDRPTPVPTTGKAIVAPKGAPTLGIYNLILNDKVELMSNATNIPPLFSSDNYPFIIFDSSKGLNLIEKAGANTHYEFDSMITGGNFHLFAFNKNEEELKNLNINDDDYILGFQKGNTPDRLFRTIYQDVAQCDVYLNDISSLKDKLISMSDDYRIDRNVIDYAIVAEPAATAIKTQLTKRGLKVVDINLQKEFRSNFYDKRDKNYIPQAGLFVRKDIKKNYPDYYNNIKNSIKDSIDQILTDPKSVKTSIESKFSTIESQNSNFGFSSNLIPLVQGEDGSKNGFGIVPNSVNFTIDDIKLFNSSLISK